MDQGKKSGKRKKVIVSAVVLVIIILVSFPGLIMWTGKHKLYSSVGGQTPDLTSAGMTVDDDGDVVCGGNRYRYDTDNINILVIGVDARGRDNTVGQGDALMLVSINSRDHSVKCISVNRDSIAPVKVYGVAGDYITTQKVQAALAYSYGKDVMDGCGLTKFTVSRLMMDIPIHGCVSVDFDDIAELNRLVGGVTLTAVEDVEKAGIHMGDRLTLTDEQAMYYVTERNSGSSEIGTNSARMKRQKQYVLLWCQALRQKFGHNISELWCAYKSLVDVATTDLTTSQLIYLAVEFEKADIEDEDIYELPGQYRRENYYDEYIVDSDKLAQMMLEIFYEKDD